MISCQNGLKLTVTIALSVLLLYIAEIDALPGATPVTNPPLATVALAGLSEDQTLDAVTSC